MTTQAIRLALVCFVFCTNVPAQWIHTNGPFGGIINCVAVSGTNLFAAGSIGNYNIQGGVYLSTNSGASWARVNTGLTDSSVHVLAVSGTNLFAGTDHGGFLTTNSGATWTLVNNGLTNTYVFAFAVSGTSIYAGTGGGGVFLSTNSGTSWTPVNTGLPDQYEQTVDALAVSGTNLFAGDDYYGVFLTTNNGANWTPVNTGLTDIPTDTHRFLSLAVSGTNLFAGTSDDGVWRRPLSELLSVPLASSESPTEFSLGQNFPNPFNPSTIIQYTLPHRAHVTLTVYNTLGQQIATLVNSDIDAGYHELQFNATSLASGVYFYRMQAGGYVQTRSLCLIR